MKTLRALMLSTWLYSLLLWVYIVARITINRVNPTSRFIPSVPFFTFINLGIISFVLSFICLIVYLSIWGFRDKDQLHKQ
jgi:hypothetical protein